MGNADSKPVCLPFGAGFAATVVAAIGYECGSSDIRQACCCTVCKLCICVKGVRLVRASPWVQGVAHGRARGGRVLVALDDNIETTGASSPLATHKPVCVIRAMQHGRWVVYWVFVAFRLRCSYKYKYDHMALCFCITCGC